MYDVGLVGCQSCAMFPTWTFRFRCRMSCKFVFVFYYVFHHVSLYLYFTMYFIRNDIIITELWSIHHGPPSLLRAPTSVPRAPLALHQGHCSSDGAQPCWAWESNPRAPTTEAHGKAAWERLDIDWQVRGSLDPQIAQLPDRNGPWLSLMEEDVGSGYRFPGFVLQPKREPSSDGSIMTEIIKR